VVAVALNEQAFDAGWSSAEGRIAARRTR